MTQEEGWKTLRKYFGYPDCCIENFIERDKMGCYMNPDQRKISTDSNHAGFVPCPDCAKKVISGETTLAGLIQNRENPAPFPDSNNPEAEQKFIEVWGY